MKKKKKKNKQPLNFTLVVNLPQSAFTKLEINCEQNI